MKRQTSEARIPVLHPYVRISDAQQRRGGGLERQLSADVAAFAREFGFVVSKKVRIDDGISAFKGTNATPEHALGQFIDEARRKIILPGDCLLLENYDRLSRQDPWAAIGLVQQLRELGIHVGRLDRWKLMRCDGTDYGDFFEAAVEFMRGNSESKMKSFRNGSRWEKKRQAARTDGITLTGKVPAWIRVFNGTRQVIESRARAVRRAFELLADGYGMSLAARKLAEEGVEAIGCSARWTKSYLYRLVQDRRVLGEFQPRKIDGSPAGEPIKDYYPAVVSEPLFAKVRAAMRRRREPVGRVTDRVELFAGLLKNARDGRAYYTGTRTKNGWQSRVLINIGAEHGNDRTWAFPLAPFEHAILSCLSELSPADVLGQQVEAGQVAELAERLANLEARESEIEEEMLKGNIPSLSRVLRKVSEEKAAVSEQLAIERERIDHPVSESWGQAKSLIDTLESSPDKRDSRVRLRAALRRIVEAIYMLVVPRGRTRLCAVQVYFVDGRRPRSYLIMNTPPKANASARQEGKLSFKSFASSGVKDDFDLRNAKHVEELARVLSETPL